MANLPADITVPTGNPGQLQVMQPQIGQIITAVRADEAFLEALKAAVASSGSWGAFQTAVASLTAV